MAFSVAASLEGAGTTASLRGSSSAHGAKLFQAFPALPSVRLDQRSRRLPCVRSQVADLQTIGRTDSDNKGRNGGAAVLPVEAQDSLMESASKFKAFLQSGGGHLPPGSLPQQHMELFMDFYNNYQGAVLGSGVHGNNPEVAHKVMMAIADRVLFLMVNRYTFDHIHKRITEPYDYYQFGQEYVKNLIDFKNSVVGHVDRFDAIEKQLAEGHNVILLANHQTEADPAVLALMLESTHPQLAREVIYVAGDRVITDPLCQPFSMGRNLWCIYSKKHINDDPSTVDKKRSWNMETLRRMRQELAQGGKLVWVAPSGGRDRPSADGQWLPNQYDPENVGVFTKLGQAAKVPAHFYAMAMHSGAMMPPPPTLQKSIGERRLTHFVPVGVSVSEELPLAEVGAAAGGPKEAQLAICQRVFDAVTEEYIAMKRAMDDPSLRGGAYQQPWLSQPLPV